MTRALLTMLAVLAMAGPARAQQPDDAAKAKANERMELGFQWANAGNHKAALAEFKAAYALTKSWDILVHIAISNTRLENWRAALDGFEQYLGEGGDQVTAEQREIVEAEIKRIRDTVATVEIAVKGPIASVRVDNELVGMSPLERPLLLSPGKYEFSAAKDGYIKVSKELEVISGAKPYRIEFELLPQVRPLDLKVSTSPAGAVLRLNGDKVGLSPWTGPIKPGTYKLEASLDGYENYERIFKFDGDMPPEPIEIELDYIHWYERRSVQIGGVVLGLATAVVVYGLVGRKQNYDNKVNFP